MALTSGLSSRLNKVSLRSKIKLIFFPPLLVLGILILYGLLQNLVEVNKAKKTVNALQIAKVMDNLAHNIALERGITAGYLGNPSEDTYKKLKAQRDKANTAKSEFDLMLQSERHTLSQRVESKFNSVSKQLSLLANVRQSVDRADGQHTPFQYYSLLNKTSLDSIALLTLELDQIHVVKNLNALTGLLWLKEKSGQERGALNGVFSSGKYSTEKLIDINAYQSAQENYLELISHNIKDQEYSDFLSVISGADKKVNELREVFKDAVKNDTEVTASAPDWFKISTDRIKLIKSYSDQASKNIIDQANWDLKIAWAMFVFTILMSGLLSFSLYKFSSKVSGLLELNINKVTDALYKVKKTSDFSVRIDVESQDEIGKAADAFNTLMMELQQAISGVSSVMSAVASGNFESRVNENFSGDLHNLKQAVNNSSEKVDVTMQELSRIMLALEEGRFSERMSDKIEGDFRRKVNDAMVKMDEAVQGVNVIMTAMRKGDFTQRIHIPLNGDLNSLKVNVNDSVSDIEKAINELICALVSQSKGKFNARINGQYAGGLENLKITFNQSMNELEGALSDISMVFNAVNSGSFSVRIEKDLEGDLGIMKNNVNRSLSNLDSAISEIVDVASAQSKGNLDKEITGSYEGELNNLKVALNRSSTQLSETIKETNLVMADMCEGKFSRRLPDNLPGEFGVLGNAINVSLDTLNSTVSNILRITDAQNKGCLDERVSSEFNGQFAQISESMNSCSEKIGSVITDVQDAFCQTIASSKEQVNASYEMSRRTEEQASSLEEIASTMEEISALVSNTEQDCVEMTTHISGMRELTNTSTKTVVCSLEAMEEMRNSSREISSITNMIDDIAFQTNLLALNAAVEAARAGTNGQGFAVVASEVRNLAQRSSDAAKNIKTLIDKNITKVDESYELSKQSSADLRSISERVETAFSLTQNVANAASEQASGVREVNSAITSLDALTQKYATMVEETTSSAKENLEQFSLVDEKLSFFRSGSMT